MIMTLDRPKRCLMKNLAAPLERRINLQKPYQVSYDRDLFSSTQSSECGFEVSLVGVAKDYLKGVPLICAASHLG